MSLPNLLPDLMAENLERLPEFRDKQGDGYTSPPTSVYRCLNCGETVADNPGRAFELGPCPSCEERVWIPT